MSLFNELKRRNVFRVGAAYVIGAWLLAQIADLLIDNIGAPDWVMKTLFVVLALGFFLSLFFAWAFEMTPEGVRKTESDDNQQPPSSSKWFEVAVVIGLDRTARSPPIAST